MQQYLEAGKVVTTHGVRGEMKLELWCDGVDFLKKTGRLYASAKGGKCYNIISIRPQGQMALLQLEGVNDMDAARAAGAGVLLRPQRRHPARGPVVCGRPHRLRGAGRRHRQGVRRRHQRGPPRRTGHLYGQVPQRQEYMFPGVDAFLKERNPPEGYLLVTPIPGLLDDDFDSEREEE